MSVEAFMAWYDGQPDGRRYELLDGRVYEMQAERLAHLRAKSAVHLALAAEIARRNLPCETFPDGMAVRVDEETVFEPDAAVRCGPLLPGETVLVVDPLIVVDVLSPTAQQIDVFRKFTRYFRNPSIVHYLIVNPADRNLAHHRRVPDGRIESRTYEEGAVSLDPPGLALSLAELFPSSEPA
jgi:Uma2 family endonuclease